MTTIPDHYAALGIDPTADPEVITAAYRALAKKFHPDTGAAAGTADAARFDAIQQAYEVLRTPETRHAYDLELLEATERELAEHIASKRRVVVRERARRREAEPDAAAAAAAPDLGDVRPEPVSPPRTKAPPRNTKPASRMPLAVPLVLVALLGAGGAWLFLPAGSKAPPQPGVTEQVAVAKPAAAPAAPTPPAAAPAATTPADKPAEKPTAANAAPPPAQGAAAADQPVFGSTGTDSPAPETEEAAAAPDAIPTPDGETVVKADKPVFGASGAAEAPAAPATPATAPAAAPAPLPKAKPAQPVQQAQQKPATKPAPAKTAAPKPPVQKQVVQQQPRARLAYQDPPQYYPEPDGYPPPDVYPPPGYDGDPRAQYDPPPGYQPGFPPPGGGPYRLVIWERQPGQPATAWSAGVVFKSMGKCTKQGVKAVLRRTSGMDPYGGGTRVWYECQRLSQR